MRKLLLLLLLIAPTAYGQCTLPSGTAPWKNVLCNTRAVDWSSVGLPATFPDGETTVNPWTPPVRTQCGTTITDTTTTEASIQSTYNACAAGTYLLLGPGQFPNWTANFNMKSNITLRGSGADPVTGTTIVCAGASISCPTWSGAGAPTCTWTPSGGSGSTTQSVTGCTPHVNDLIVFEVNGPNFDIGTGDMYDCKPLVWGICGQTANGGSPQGQIEQLMRVTAFSAPTVTFDPPMRFNYANSNYTTPVSALLTSPVTGAGFENMRVLGELTAGSAVPFMVNGYADWITGVQWINNALGTFAPTSTIVVQDCHHCLIFENDIWQGLTQAGGAGITLKTVSDTLIMNNDVHVGNIYCQPTGCVDVVFAYNYIHDSYYPSSNKIITNVLVSHNFSHFDLWEGNEAAGIQWDMSHEAKSNETAFRNNFYGADPPFLNAEGVRAMEASGYSRFANFIGNITGVIPNYTSPVNHYKDVPDGTGINCTTHNSVFWLGCNGQNWPLDTLTPTTAMLWGNCDLVNAACQFNNADVPSAYNEYTGTTLALTNSSGNTWTGTLPANGALARCVYGQNIANIPGSPVGNLANNTYVLGYDESLNGTLTGANRGIAASPASTVDCSSGGGAVSITLTSAIGTPVLNYVAPTNSAGALRNAIPGNHTLPPSFLGSMPAESHAHGGTQINWWKVCTNYPTCTTFKVQPYPLAGPDVANGPYTTVAGGGSGTAYDVPMKIWDQNSPIDTTLQVSYSISSWGTFSGGQQPITLATAPSSTLQLTGEFQITGASPAGCNGTYHISAYTPSSTPIVQFGLASNPGCSGGTFLFPDVHRFSNTAFVNDGIPWVPNPNGRDYVNGGANGRNYSNGVTGANGRKYP